MVPSSAFLRHKAAKEKTIPRLPPISSEAKVNIIDIRRAAVEISLKSEIRTLFLSTDGPRTLPTLLLYNERGLQLFESVSLSPLPLPLACYALTHFRLHIWTSIT